MYLFIFLNELSEVFNLVLLYGYDLFYLNWETLLIHPVVSQEVSVNLA